MSAQGLEQRARDFLAAEYDDSDPDYAEFLRSYSQPPFADDERAIRAIVAALRQQPAPVDLEQFREAVEFMQMRGTREQCIRAGDMLQAIIDNAGKAECPHDAWEENGGARRCADCHKYLGEAPHQPAPVVDDAMRELIEAADKAKRAYWLARNSAAGLTNYCEESANSRRCERELDEAERIYRDSGFEAALARAQGVQS